MNSKQLNFFLSPEDLPIVYDFFNNMGIKYARINDPEEGRAVFEDFPYTHGRPHDQLYISAEPFFNNVYTKMGRIIKEYSVDLDKSYVLQFTPGGFYPASSTVLNRGRFCCTTSYYVSNGASVAKPNEFKSWVDKFFKTFKKEFLVKMNEDRVYLTPKTIEWMKQTGAAADESLMHIVI